MNLTGFTYYITVDSVETELFPYFPPDAVTLEFEDERDEIFGFYRKTLETPLVFKGASYDFLLALEDSGDCGVYEFSIRYNGVEKFAGLIRFCTNAMAWDRSKCRVTVRVDNTDAYQCLVEAWEDEINILTGTTKVEVGYSSGEIAYITCEEVRTSSDPGWEDFETPVDSCISGQQAWVLYQHWVTDGGSTRTWTSTYVREEYTAACSGASPIPPAGDGWLLEDDNCPTDALYVRELVQGTPFPVDGDYIFSIEYEIAGLSGDGLSIDNGVRLDHVLDTFNPCAGGIVSDFFTINPDSTHPVNDPYTEALANLANVIIFQKSDVKRPSVSGNATNGKWTLKDILEVLKYQFNVEPRIFSGDLRLEHVSYWEQETNGTDLTAGSYAERIAGLYAYTYDSVNAGRAEKWTFQDRCSLAFEGIPVTYETYPSSAPIIEYPISRVTNDVEFISDNPDSIQDDGFVFVAAGESGGVYFMVSETNVYIPTQTNINGHMSIPNLLDHYHKYGRLQPSGTMNGAIETFESSIRRKIQVDLQVKIPVQDYFDMDFSHLIKTQIGWGKVEKAGYNAASCTLTLTLRHE